MNHQNKKRHILSKLKKVLVNKSNTIDIINQTQDFISDKYCLGCVHDDFGYCDNNESDENRHLSNCIPMAIKYIERL